MHQLATFTTTDEQGQDVLIRADQVRMVREHSGNTATVFFIDGSSIVVSSSVSDAQSSINALWDAWIAALP